jgi:hypothetical protein
MKDWGKTLCLLDGVKMVADLLVHAEHVNLRLLEDGLHLLIAKNLSPVVWILEVVGLDVCPETLDNSGS